MPVSFIMPVMAPYGNLANYFCICFSKLVRLSQILSSLMYTRSGTIISVHANLLEFIRILFSLNQVNDILTIQSEGST